jgi:hypothetical protein
MYYVESHGSMIDVKKIRSSNITRFAPFGFRHLTLCSSELVSVERSKRTIYIPDRLSHPRRLHKSCSLSLALSKRLTVQSRQEAVVIISSSSSSSNQSAYSRMHWAVLFLVLKDL